jgi:hypothetical protein
MQRVSMVKAYFLTTQPTPKGTCSGLAELFYRIFASAFDRSCA